MIGSSVSIVSNGEYLIVGDPTKGFIFLIINEEGETVREMNIPYEKRKVTAADKKKIMDNYKKRVGERFAELSRRNRFVFPKYYPPFSRFRVDNQRIYAYTDKVKDGKREWNVIDFKGNIIKKSIMLPSGHPSTFYKGKMYYLVEKEEYSELHVIDVI